jgi:4-amino-4-deoxy-L-arabinose transferase-like glycosyltransferase
MKRRQTLLLLCLITGLALGMRIWRLDTIPPGLWWDEGHHDQRALDMLQGGARPVYFTEADGFEPLHIYLTALLFRLFGVHYLATRWVSALTGALTVPALYWATVEWLVAPLGHSRARRVGLGAAFCLAVIFPHVLISRIGFEVVLVPAGTVLMLAALGRGVRTQRIRWFILSGLFLGGTYHDQLYGVYSPSSLSGGRGGCANVDRSTRWLALCRELSHRSVADG